MLNPQLLVNCHGDALLGSQFETISLVQTSQAGTQEKKHSWLCPGIETSLRACLLEHPQLSGLQLPPPRFPYYDYQLQWLSQTAKAKRCFRSAALALRKV